MASLFPAELRAGPALPKLIPRLIGVWRTAMSRVPRDDRSKTMRNGSRTSRFTGITLVFLSAALWATVGVAVRLVPGAAALPAEAFGLARTMLAGPLILIAVLPFGLCQSGALRRLSPYHLVAFALACFIFQVCLFRAFTELGVTITVVMTVCLPPVISILWSTLRGARTGPGGWLALALAALGLGLFSAPQLAADASSGNAGGTVFALTASVAFVWMSRSARVLGREGSPILVAGLGLTISGMMFCLAFPWLAATPLPTVATVVRDWQLLGLLLYLAVVPTALAYVCYCSGIARCRSTDVGLIASMIEPAMAAVLAMSLLHERLSAIEIAGCLLMTLAMGVLMQTERGWTPLPAAA